MSFLERFLQNGLPMITPFRLLISDCLAVSLFQCIYSSVSFLIIRFIKDILILAGDETKFAATFVFTVWLVPLPLFSPLSTTI